MKYPKQLDNLIFGRLTVIQKIGFNKWHQPIYNCKCECGNIKEITRQKLVAGTTKSCGCFKKEYWIEKNTKHGLSKTRIYKIFRGMSARCNNKNNSSYNSYGGRGVKIEWKNFEEFFKDMNESYIIHVDKFGIKDTTIERIDVNGNYCLSNCKWATQLEQARNKRKKISVRVKKCISCPRCGFSF